MQIQKVQILHNQWDKPIPENIRHRFFKKKKDTNYAAPQCNGHSMAVSPIAFNQQEEPLNTVILEAGEYEGIFLAEFELDEIRTYRQREVWGNAFRKPGCYDLMNSMRVEKPFIRITDRR